MIYGWGCPPVFFSFQGAKSVSEEKSEAKSELNFGAGVEGKGKSLEWSGNAPDIILYLRL